MESFELILFLLGAVVVSAIIEHFVPRISLPLVQIAIGALIAAFVTTELSHGLDAELLLILFIAPLHFNESRHVNSGKLWKNRKALTSLAFFLVLAIMACVGTTLHAFLPTLPLAACLALGAAMGSTDAVAVNGATKDYHFSKRHDALLKGETLFNDVTGTVAFQCCSALLLTGTFSILHTGEEFALDFFGGAIGGVVLGFIAWFLLEFIRWRGVENPTIHVALEILLPFVIYLVAEHLHIGGIIAVVCAGMVMSLMPQKHNASTARQKLQSKSVWETFEFILNGAIFVILGMQLPSMLAPIFKGSEEAWVVLLSIAVATIVLEGVRFAWIVGIDFLHNWKLGDEDIARSPSRSLKAISLREDLAMAFAAPKGGITLSLMLTIPYASAFAIDDRQLLISVASGMILLTIILANFAVPALVPRKIERARTKERADREISLILRVIESIRKDAHMTGNVRSDKADEISNTPDAIDEPATIIVMKRYADMLEDLAKSASEKMANLAKAEDRKINAEYAKISEIANEVDEMAPDENLTNALEIDTFNKLQKTYDAIEDVQAQALSRELQFIKEMKMSGQLDPEHADSLRDDVYIQQLAL